MRAFGILFALLAPIACSGQVTGGFSLEKTTFAPGEPVFLSFTLKNEGKGAQDVVTADPYSFCSGYELHVTRDGATAPACLEGYGGSCPGGERTLAPGETRTERILLNFENHARGEFGLNIREPGDYTVDAKREIAYAPPGAGSPVFNAPNRRDEHEVLHFRVDDAVTLSSGVYSAYVEQLTSKDVDVRREAARTLATLAPPALEPILLGFATSQDPSVRQFAPLALSNLNTKASLAALAQMLLHTDPGTYESMTAAKDLGKTHDPAWFPLLLEVADQHGAMYLGYAAESGGEAAVPALAARLRTVAPDNRTNVIAALGMSGSRAAIPVLIGLLGNSQAGEDGRNEAISADIALEQLTHLRAEQEPDGSSIPSLRGRWQRWWNTFGATATVYKPEDCAAHTVLP